MPSIDPTFIPLVTPGNVFTALSENTTLAIRWLTAQDPHFFDTYNRPMADITVRQLIIAKSVDQLGLRLSHQSNFPFLIPATVDVASATIAVPLSWIWDMHMSLKDSWENLRLVKIQRFSGTNDPTSGFTGTMRLVFTANPVGGGINNEVGIFYVDYDIGSTLTYQIKTIRPVTVSEFDPALPSNEENAIAGFVTFRTLDTEENEAFFVALAPPSEATGSPSFEEYEISDTPAGGSGIGDDYSFTAVSHGTGMTVNSASNAIPPIGVDQNSVLAALNYPWRTGTNLTSTDQLTTIPSLLFSQFIMTAPMGDRQPEVSSENYPVFCSKIRRLDASADQLEMFFSTTNTVIGSESDSLIEFCSVILDRSLLGVTSGPGSVIEIIPNNNLKLQSGSDDTLFRQNFGSGFVILSSEWAFNETIEAFFDSFLGIVDEPAERFFEAQLNEFALHRTPLNVPTIGQAQALVGSTSRRETPLNPSDDNRYVTEADQGLGDKVDFSANDELDDNKDISSVGYSGSLLMKSVVLEVDTANNSNFDYATDILPRLRILLSRDPIHGDEWFDGTVFKRYDGLSQTWIG